MDNFTGVKFITLQGKKIPTELKRFRRASLADIPILESLVTAETINMFGPQNFPLMIENAPYAMIGENLKGNPIFFICMYGHPDVPSILPELWEDWMETISTGFHTESTRFIRCLLCNNKYDISLLTKAYLQQFFLDIPKARNVCFITSPLAKPLNLAMKKVFTSVLRPIFHYVKTNQALYFCRRYDILPELIMRMACPSDNDDIMALLESKIPNAIKMFGEFYVAETLYNKNDSTKIIVAELLNQIVGFIWLHSDVDLEKINENYEVFPFDTMKKHYPGCETHIETYYDVVEKEDKEMFEAGMKASVDTGDDNDDDDDKEAPDGYFINKEMKPDKTSSIFFDNDEKMFFENFNKQLQFGGTCPLSFLNCSKFLTCDEFVEKKEKEQIVKKAESDVFAIEMCIISSTLDDRMSFDLIKAAFNVFDDKCHCVCSFPISHQTPIFARYFTRITHRYTSVMKDVSLYITHKNVILGKTSVRRLEISDLDEVKKLLRYGTKDEMKTAAEILDIIDETFYAIETRYDALIIHSEGTTIGLIILCPEDNIKMLMKYFDIEEIFNFDVLNSDRWHGRILYLYLHPLFDSRNAYIFQQIFRITDYNIIYYYTENFIVSNVHNNLLSDMIPVRPRRVFNIHEEQTYEDLNLTEEHFKTLEPFPLYYQSIRRSSVAKRNCDMKIILNGGFVQRMVYETLLFSPEYQGYKFNNLYALVVPGAVFAQYTEKNEMIRNLILNVSNTNYLKRLGITTWVSFIFGFIKHIIRPQRLLLINDGRRVKYDILVLMGRAFNGLPIAVPQNQTHPLNYIGFNSLNEVHNCCYKLKFMNEIYSNGFNIIVYGIALQTYTTITLLLQQGIRGENIYLIIPPHNSLDDRNVNPFTDDFIEKKLFETLKLLKINVYKGYEYLQWTLGNNGAIKYVTFESKFECVNIYCDVFISLFKKVVSRAFRKVLIKSGLVFDGSLVIDHRFRTNDPRIYSAGYLAKYKRELLANKYRHWYYDGSEVVSQLIKYVLEDAKLVPKEEAKHERFIPNFTRPLVIEAIFPYNLYYYSCTPPGFCLPHYVYKQLDYYGIDLITGRDFNKTFEGMSKDQKGYFHIHLDKKGFIKSISCLSKKKYPGEFFYQIWGCHEKLFCNLRSNYDRGLITDFHDFFVRKWSLPIINSRLGKFHRNTEKYILRYLMQDPEMKSLILNVIKGKKHVLTETEKDQLKQSMKIPKSVHLLEVYFKHYIMKNSDEFFLPTSAFVGRGNCETFRA